MSELEGVRGHLSGALSNATYAAGKLKSSSDSLKAVTRNIRNLRATVPGLAAELPQAIERAKTGTVNVRDARVDMATAYGHVREAKGDGVQPQLDRALAEWEVLQYGPNPIAVEQQYSQLTGHYLPEVQKALDTLNAALGEAATCAAGIETSLDDLRRSNGAAAESVHHFATIHNMDIGQGHY